MVALRQILALHPSRDPGTPGETRKSPQPRRADRRHRASNKIGANTGWLNTATWSVVALTTALLPCVVSFAGKDSFRAPKEFLLRGSAILIAAAMILAVLFTPDDVRRALSSVKAQASATAVVIGWLLVTTLTSTNRLLSAWSLIYASACAVFFLGASYAVRNRTWHALYALFIPALANTGALLLQQFRIWDVNPLNAPSTRAALLGNGNDVGGFLLAPAVAAAAISMITPVRRALNISIAAALALGILLSQSLTAVGAYAAAVLAICILRSWKKAVAGGAVIALIFAVAVMLYSPLRSRAELIRKALASRDYDTLSSFRLTAFAAADQMFAKHPLTGVGPGCYALWYFDEKITAEVRHAVLRNSGDPLHNYGEAHSDYLQALAIGGLPAFAILIAALVILGSFSFRQSEKGIGGDFSRAASFPLAVGFAVLFLAGFPLELAGPATSILFATAICSAGRPLARD